MADEDLKIWIRVVCNNKELAMEVFKFLIAGDVGIDDLRVEYGSDTSVLRRITTEDFEIETDLQANKKVKL